MEITEMAMPAGTPNIARRQAGRLAAGASVLVAALGAAAALGVTPAHAATTDGNTTVGVYSITNSMSGMVADITGASMSWLTPVEDWPSTNGENQKWRFVKVNPDTSPQVMVEDQASGTYTTTNAYQIVSDPNSGGTYDCLEAEGDNPTAGDGVEVYGCNPNAVDQPNQVWYPITFNGRTQLINGISAQSTDVFFRLANGSIQTQWNSATAQNALALTPVGELNGDSDQGNQLVLEPSDFDTYLWWQDWTVDPTEYAVDTPTETIAASSLVGNDYYYGCFNGWNPQVSTVNGSYELNYQKFTSDSSMAVSATPYSGSGAQPFYGSTVNGVSSLWGAAVASSNEVEVEYANYSVSPGSVHIQFYCQPGDAGQLTG